MSASGGSTVSPIRRCAEQPTIDAWAEISGDHNPLHVDPVYAAATRFGGTIAHGHLTLAWMSEAAVTWWGPAWLRGGSLMGVRFTSPVKPGSWIRIEGEYVESEDEHRRCRISVVDETDGRLCIVGTAVIPNPVENGDPR